MLAKQTVGNFANLKPDNPAQFLEAIGAVLAQYPLGIGRECADPVHGIARKVEFLSVKAVADWCNVRRDFYCALARYEAPPAPRQIEAGPITAEQCENLMAKLAEVLRANTAKSPLDTMLDEVAAKRRLRVEEIARAGYGGDAA